MNIKLTSTRFIFFLFRLYTYKMGLFDFFKSSKEESPRTQEPTWDPNTMTIQQPSSPSAPVVDRAVSEQPVCHLKFIEGEPKEADC